jgi:cyclophilin family peptidyl-prolyl cis-trans isomerase
MQDVNSRRRAQEFSWRTARKFVTITTMKNVIFILLLLSASAVCRAQIAKHPYDLPDGLYSEITTPRGVVVCELFYQKTPLTVANHVGLAEGTLGPRKGQPFYDGLTWHRVVPEFVVQGGDGGRLGYQFPDECVPGLRHDSIGVLQMANAGPDTNGSQFCLMLNETERLNYNHTVFGHVVRGIEVLPKIQQGDTMQVKILRLGTAAQAFKADQDAFDALVAKANRYTGPRSPGPDAFFDDPDQLLPTNIPRASDFNHKLANFERFTNERIIARLLAKTPDDAQAEKREAFLHALAEKAKVDQRGALAVYLADQDEWQIYIAPNSAASFIAGPRNSDGTKPVVANDKTLDQARQEFLAAARQQADQFISTAAKAANGQPLTPGQKIKFQVDAILDGLIFRLEPAASTPAPSASRVQ